MVNSIILSAEEGGAGLFVNLRLQVNLWYREIVKDRTDNLYLEFLTWVQEEQVQRCALQPPGRKREQGAAGGLVVKEQEAAGGLVARGQEAAVGPVVRGQELPSPLFLGAGEAAESLTSSWSSCPSFSSPPSLTLVMARPV